MKNRPGTVAEIALALGRAGVNIEDMALYPAPDMRTGAVSLWVAGDEEAERAAEVVARPRPRGRRSTAMTRASTPSGRSRRAAPAARQVDLPPRGADRRDGGETDADRAATSTSADTRSTLEAVRRSGAGVVDRAPPGRAGSRSIRARACAAPPTAPSGRIDVGNAGTLLRLLPGWLAGQGEGAWTLDGDESIRRRPVDRVAEPLRQMGAEVECRDGRLPPLEFDGRALRGIDYACRWRARR